LNFSDFDASDREKALYKSTPLYVQLFLGQNFLLESSTILKHKKCEQQSKNQIWKANFAQKRFLDRFSSATGLFLPGSDLDIYGRLVQKLKALPEISSLKKNAILAYILLFYPLTNDSSLEDLYNNSIKTCDNCLSLTTLISTLTSMDDFCTENIFWNESYFYTNNPNSQFQGGLMSTY